MCLFGCIQRRLFILPKDFTNARDIEDVLLSRYMYIIVYLTEELM
jgi:hypothetical protein